MSEIAGLDEFRVDGSDELSELAAAFNSVQQTAVNLASEQARIRHNVAEMFVNLGRRNQGLLNRTLSFISELERTEQDPETLDDLFRLDHLTTRMRRNAESLLVLAGSEPARTWSKPVAVGNVVRAALSEIESYDRVDFHEVEPARVKGNAIADVAHLLAELIENATTFSPPTSRVRLVGERAAEGYVISVIDKGIGLAPVELIEANRRIEQVARLDLAPTKVLGLYVVGRLAARHGIEVKLADAVAGGLAVTVKLPPSIVEARRRNSDPAARTGGGRRHRGQRRSGQWSRWDPGLSGPASYRRSCTRGDVPSTPGASAASPRACAAHLHQCRPGPVWCLRRCRPVPAATAGQGRPAQRHPGARPRRRRAGDRPHARGDPLGVVELPGWRHQGPRRRAGPATLRGPRGFCPVARTGRRRRHLVGTSPEGSGRPASRHRTRTGGRERTERPRSPGR